MSANHEQAVAVMKAAGMSDDTIKRLTETADMAGQQLEEKRIRFKAQSADAPPQQQTQPEPEPTEPVQAEEKPATPQTTEEKAWAPDVKAISDQMVELQSNLKTATDQITALRQIVESFMDATPRGSRSETSKMVSDDLTAFFQKAGVGVLGNEAQLPQAQAAKSFFDMVNLPFEDGSA